MSSNVPHRAEPDSNVLVVLLGVLVPDVDCQPQRTAAEKAHQQVAGMEAGEIGCKCGGESVHKVQQLLSGVHTGGKPPQPPQLGGIEAEDHIGDIGENELFQTIGQSSRSPLLPRSVSFPATGTLCRASSTEDREAYLTFLLVHSLKTAVMAPASRALKKTM